MNVNVVILGGNLTRDPELSYTPQGVPVCKFGLAMNEQWKDAQGDKKEKVCFVDIVVWRKQAESCSQYLKKGNSCLIEGKIQQDKWVDKKTGAKRSKLFIVAKRVIF